MILASNPEIHELGVQHQLSDRIRLGFYLAMAAALLVIAAIVAKSAGQAILAGGLVGLFAHWRMTATCRMTIYDAKALELARSALLEHRYQPFQGRADHYRLSLPRLLFFNQQDVFLDLENGAVSVVGPRNVLTMIKRQISRR